MSQIILNRIQSAIDNSREKAEDRPLSWGFKIFMGILSVITIFIVISFLIQ